MSYWKHPNKFREWWWFVPFRRKYIPEEQLWGVPNLRVFLESILVRNKCWPSLEPTDSDSDFELPPPPKRKWWYRECTNGQGDTLYALAIPKPSGATDELMKTISEIVTRHGFWFNYFPPVHVKHIDDIFHLCPW